MSMARLVAGAATNQPFAEPDIIAATGVVGSTGVDHTAVASLKFANGIVAQLTTSIVCELPSTTEIYGRLGVMRLDDPWLPSSPSRHAEQPLPLDMEFPDSEIEIELFSGEVQKHAVKCDRDLYSYEIDEVAACLSARQSPAMSWDDSLGNARALDEWRAAVFRHRT
jgi:predicted dehydrogenase